MKVTDTLTPEGNRFYAELEKLKKMQVHIGFQAGESFEESGEDIAEIAANNELGTLSIPSRPFLRKTVDENDDKIRMAGVKEADNIIAGKSAETALNRLGVLSVSLVQEKIVDGEYASNSPLTIKLKGSDKPLIDSGRMRQSVKYIVEQKGG